MRSPCLSCQWLEFDKNAPRCEKCRKRLDYVAGLEQAPECRQDPCYAAAFSIPRSFSRQLGQVTPFSQMQRMIAFLR